MEETKFEKPPKESSILKRGGGVPSSEVHLPENRQVTFRQSGLKAPQ